MYNWKVIYLIMLVISFVMTSSSIKNVSVVDSCGKVVMVNEMKKLQMFLLGEKWTSLMSSLIIDDAKKLFDVCSGCHSLSKDLHHKLGPNLFGVVGRLVASYENFAYSPALKSMGEGRWTLNRLNKFLKNPSNYIEGTYMTFVGINLANDRLSIIKFLSLRCYNYN